MADTLTQTAIGNQIYNKFVLYKSERETWAKNAAEDEDFFLGRQWSAQEEQTMREKGMSTVVVNRTMPAIMQEVAIFTSKRPTFKALPRDDSDVKLASLWSDILAFVWYNSNGDLQWQQSVLDYFVKGAGYIQAYIDPYADDGNGEVFFKSIPVWDVYPDPNSREIDLSDARSIIVSRIYPEDSLIHSYPDKAGIIRAAATDTGAMVDKPFSNPAPADLGYGISPDDYDFIDTSKNSGRKVRLIENYEKVRVEYYRVFNLSTGVTSFIRASDVDDPEKFFGPSTSYVKIWRKQVRLTAVVGQRVLYRVMLPTAHYPVVPLFLHHTRNPFPFGDVSVIKGMQKELNKRRSVIMHNATLAGNYRIKAQKGAIHNKRAWEESGTKPSSILEWNQGFEEPKEMLPQGLPVGFFQLEDEAKRDIEYSISVFSTMMGSPTDAPDTYRSLLALDEAGQRKLRHKIQHANSALRILGMVCMDFCREIYKMPKVMRIAGEDNMEYREIYINKPRIDPDTKRLVYFNDISVGKYDVVVVDGTSMPTNRMALMNLYMDLYDRGIVDKVEVLKKSDVVDKEALIQRLGEIQTLTAQLSQMQEALKDIEGLNQTLRRQLQQSEIRNEVLKGSEGIRDALRQTRAQQQVLKGKAANDLAYLNKRMELARQEVRLEGRKAALSVEAGRIAAESKMKELSNGKK